MNGIDLIQAHGKLTETVIDLDALEPLPPAEPRQALAQAIWDRAQHLRAVMEAADHYVEAIVLDCAAAGFPEFVYRDPLVDRRQSLIGLVDELERHARRTCPGVEFHESKPRPLSAAVAAFPAEVQAVIDSMRKLEELSMEMTAFMEKNVSRR